MRNSFKELKSDELAVKRGELRKKYFDFRFQAVVGHVENPVEARNLRRQIARVETLINNVGKADVPAGKPGVAAAAPAASAAKKKAAAVAKTAKK